jgi:predicted deacylase
MTRIVSRFPLPPMTLGTERHLTVHTYGDPDATPKVYLQGGIHAGELPGPLALHHLIRRLDAGEDEITGHIMIVPVANPIGLAQNLRGAVSGRFSTADGTNFNRRFPDIAGAVAQALDGRLGADAAENIVLVREAMADILADLAADAVSENDYLRITLMRLACDADLVLDLHCEEEGLVHLYLNGAHWPREAGLAALLDSEITFLTELSNELAFEEALTKPCLTTGVAATVAATVEFRGAGDVGDAMAEEDADRLYRVLQRAGAVAGDADTPETVPAAVPVTGMDRVIAPVPGIISFRVPLGARVTAGQPIADLIDPTADDPAEGRVELYAATDGVVFARRIQRFAPMGAIVAKVAGERPLNDTPGGHLANA